MKLKFSLTSAGRPARDLVATLDAGASVGDLAERLLRSDPDRRGEPVPGRPTLAVLATDTRALDPNVLVTDSGLRSGSALSVVPAGSSHTGEGGSAAAVLTVLSGPDAGREFPLAHGSSVIGRETGADVRLTDPLVSRQHARVNVTDVVEVVDLGSANGISLSDATVARCVLRPGDVAGIGDSSFSIRLVRPERQDVGGRAIEGFIRSPRLDPQYEGVERELPDPPERPSRQRFPIVALIAPLIIGAFLYVLTKSATSLVFIALSPVMLIGNAIEARIGGKAEYKRALAQWRADLEDLAAEADAAAREEVEGRNHEQPAVRACFDGARRGDPLVWARRPGEPGFLELRLGTGRLPARNRLVPPEAKQTPRDLLPEIEDFLERFRTVDGVPVVARPAEDGAIGVAGPREAMLGVARALVAELCILHSPAEVVVCGLASNQTSKDWDWIKWLPHTSSPHSPIGARQLAAAPGASTDLVSELEELVEHRLEQQRPLVVPAVVLIVENDALVDHSRLVQLAEHGSKAGVHVLWLADLVAHLPAACRTYVDVSPPGDGGSVGFLHSNELVTPVALEPVDSDTAADFARQMAPMVDVGAHVLDDSDLPRSVSLLTLVGPELASSPSAVVERWLENRSILTGPYAPPPTHHAGTLRAVVGQAAGQPLALDLRSDGPHALVGGTTGSGKSELLQAWILSMAAAHSPQRLTFLLVDYKGGSAFRDCTALPHTVGLVTDLSPHLVRRALTSLAAELRYREHFLATYKAKDLVSLEKQGIVDAPPSLVIVVDEFAALVNEVPEFVDGVVNVAQRGRSLGLHLILATQRPAGVIKDNLRANTNLRLALRMADEADSSDVLDSPDAAFFDPAVPGRAVSKTGPGRLSSFQSGYAGGWTTDTPPPPEIEVEELTFGSGAEWELPEAPEPVEADRGPTDIQRLVASVGGAAELAGVPAPRKPWMPELRPLYDLADQGVVPSRRRDDELVFGIKDIPDEQAQPTVAFHPDRDGSLAVYGTGGSGKSTLLRTLAIAAGFTVRGGPCHVYGLDFGARGLAMLEDLPHVGSIIQGSDQERVTRLLSWLRSLIDERAARYSQVNAGTITDYRAQADAPDEPRILLLVDGVAAFRQAYETSQLSSWFDMFASIASEGRPVGVHVILSSDQRSGMTTALASAVQARVVLRLATPDDYGLLGVPEDVLETSAPAGRGLFGESEVQIAVLGGSGDVLEQGVATRAFARAMERAGVTPAPPIQRLAERISLDALPSQVDERPVLGVASSTLQPCTFDPKGTFIVSGPPGSGRTQALLAVAESLSRWRPEIQLFLLTGQRSALLHSSRWSETARGPEAISELADRLAAELRSGDRPGPLTAVFVENAGDHSGGLADMSLEELTRACVGEDALIVFEGETTSFTSSYGLLGAAKVSRAGIALAPDQTDGPTVYRTDFPRTNRADFPVGRGLLVALGRAELVQVGEVGR